MSKWVHRMVDGVCQHCGPGPTLTKDGRQVCAIARRAQRGSKRKYSRPWTEYKGTRCEKCGFEGHPVQLDVHHKDHDKNNNDPSNLETLCANCHRLHHNDESPTS